MPHQSFGLRDSAAKDDATSIAEPKMRKGFLYNQLREVFANATDEEFDAYYKDAKAHRSELTDGAVSKGVKYAVLGFVLSLLTRGRIPFTSVKVGKRNVALFAGLIGVFKSVMVNNLNSQKELMSKHIELFAKNPKSIRFNPMAQRMVKDFNIAQATLAKTPDHIAQSN